ncbi:MAG: hypothetical protein J6T10_06210 [Methanobrevibacter sp.]|nr:hypothetical protein [Methanobrevibacter sp.]
MAYFNNKQNVKGGGYIPLPIPEEPGYEPTPVPSVEPGSTPVIPLPTFIGNAVVTLYHNADEHRVLNKRLSDEREFNIVLKEETSSLNPQIILQSDYDLSTYNYAFIDVTNRYYYCVITLMENGLFVINMEVDVLMSYKDGIKNLIALVERVENTDYKNMDIPNNDIITQRGTTTKIIKYPRSLDKNNQYVLVTNGKAFNFQ